MYCSQILEKHNFYQFWHAFKWKGWGYFKIQTASYILQKLNIIEIIRPYLYNGDALTGTTELLYQNGQYIIVKPAVAKWILFWIDDGLVLQNDDIDQC